VLGAFVGALAGLWIAVLGRVFLGDMPVSFSALAEIAMIGAGCGVALGASFPKIVLILGFPFASLGVGS
jgi:EamA domain-containing membrane protein RarD